MCPPKGLRGKPPRVCVPPKEVSKYWVLAGWMGVVLAVFGGGVKAPVVGGWPLGGWRDRWWRVGAAAAGLVDLADVASEVDKSPLGLASGKSAAGEPSGSSMGFGMSKAAFNEPPPLPVTVAMFGFSEPGLHAMSCPGGIGGGVGEGWRRCPDLVVLVAWSDQQQRPVEVVLEETVIEAPVAGVGEDGTGWSSTGSCQVGDSELNHGLELPNVGSFSSDGDPNNDLVCRHDRLGVVSLDEPTIGGLLEATVGIGHVASGLAASFTAPPFLVVFATLPRPFRLTLSRLNPPQTTFGLSVPPQLRPTTTTTTTTTTTVVVAAVTVAAATVVIVAVVIVGVGVGLVQDLLDLGTQSSQRCNAAVRSFRGGRFNLGAIKGHPTHIDQSPIGTRPEHLDKQRLDHIVNQHPEPGNRRVIRCHSPTDRLIGHIPTASRFQLPRRAFPLAIPEHHQRQHHRWIKRRTTPLTHIGPIAGINPRQIKTLNHLNHRPHQLVVGQQLPIRRRLQKRLLTIRNQKHRSHTPTLTPTREEREHPHQVLRHFPKGGRCLRGVRQDADGGRGARRVGWFPARGVCCT